MVDEKLLVLLHQRQDGRGLLLLESLLCVQLHHLLNLALEQIKEINMNFKNKQPHTHTHTHTQTHTTHISQTHKHKHTNTNTHTHMNSSGVSYKSTEQANEMHAHIFLSQQHKTF